ncbi:MAG: site-2 protease family protein [Planctomycetota bacterium]
MRWIGSWIVRTSVPATVLLHGAVFLPAAALLPQLSGRDPIELVLIIVLLAISLGIHEAAHGWVALQCGDTTARDLGRITLNPIPHIDPVWTLLIPAVMYWQTGFIFGGAKPVPVAFHRLRHPWRDMSLVAMAGPISNVLLAVFFLTALHFFVNTGFYNNAAADFAERSRDLLPRILTHAALFNVLLAVFNMVPIPPLDGSRVMSWVLPAGLREPYDAIGRFGLVLVFGLVFLVPAFSDLLNRAVLTMLRLLDSMVSLGGLW